MLGSDQFKQIRLTSVGQNEEKVQSRVKEIWLSLPKTKREEILNLSGLSVHAATRTYQRGKISLKFALALAQTQNINPYYLSGASDEREGCSDEIINKFLAANGHADVVSVTSTPSKKANTKSTNGKTASKPDKDNIPSDTNNKEETASPEPENVSKDETSSDNEKPKTPVESINTTKEKTVQPDTPVASPPAVTVKQIDQNTPYEKLLSTIQEKVCSITETEQEKLDAMPAEAAEQLLKGLLLRTEYSEDAKYLSSLVKMLLII